jgi:DNA polymerase-3 subunit alpha
MKEEKRKHNHYIPLHGHSVYSFGDGVTKIEDIIARTKEIGADAVALTEHGNMSSFLKFYKAAKESNIKPIIGCELYLNDLYYENKEKFLLMKKGGSITDDEGIGADESDEYGQNADNNHCLVYAKNYTGVSNIIHLSNVGFQNFYRKPLIDTKNLFSMLDENNIVTTGCMQSKFNQMILAGNVDEAAKLIKKYRDKFGDDFYLEIQLNQLKEQQQINDFYQMVHKKTGIKPVFALDYHYANKDDWYIQYLLYVIKQRKTVKTMKVEDWFYNVRDLYIKEIDGIYERAEKYGLDKKFLELAIDSTFEIRDKVDIDIKLYPNNFPKFTDDAKDSEATFLKKLETKFYEKVKNKLIPNDKVDEYLERLKYEIDVITSKGFVDYFLILDDLLTNFVYKVGGATGAGRGSAPASLVLFVLDITKLDPIRHNLIFSRFINPERIDPADVDLDIDSETQKQVEEYLKQRWGDNKVCHIANFIKFGSKTIIKDLCRVFELDFVLSNKLTSYFDELKVGELSIEEELQVAESMAAKRNEIALLKFIEDNRKIFIKYGDKLMGMIRQTGRHASGTLISNQPLSNSALPILKVGGEIVTGVQEGADEREVSELGYCKLDILGLKTASIINNTFKLIEKQYGIRDLETKILLSNFDDEQVYKEFERGNCRDIFQFGSDNMIALIKKVKPVSEKDLSTINALWRPAIINSGGVDEYLYNKKNKEEAKERLDQVHKKLWPLLEESFGIPVFQEQIMFILQDIGGFSLAEADKGRKILKLLHKGNQDKTEAFFKMLDKFQQGAKNNGVSQKDLDWLLDIMGKYSEYSFNKSHSLSYSINAYITMYLKVHYPKEYYATLLNYSAQDEISWFMKQAKMSGITFNEFKIGNTSDNYTVDYKNNSIRMGLNLVKGVSSADIEKINALTATNLVELTEQVSQQKISKRSFEPLCRLNYFSGIFKNSRLLEIIFNECKRLKKKQTYEDKIKLVIEENKDLENYTEKEFQQFEKKYLQFYISEHPFEKAMALAQEKVPELIDFVKSPKDVDDDSEEGASLLLGVINDIILKTSKKSGKKYYKIILEDDEKQLYVTVFNTVDMTDLEIGDIIVIMANKDNYGFSKMRDYKIQKLN